MISSNTENPRENDKDGQSSPKTKGAQQIQWLHTVHSCVIQQQMQWRLSWIKIT